MRWPPTGWGSRACGRTPFPVTCQLCWSESLGYEDETVVRQLVQWRIYTRRRGLKLDLVILDERAGEPADRLRRELQTGVAGEMLGKSGGVFFLTADKVPTDDAVLLAAAARAVLGGGRGSLTEQIDRRAAPAARSAAATHSGCGRDKACRAARPTA